MADNIQSSGGPVPVINIAPLISGDETVQSAAFPEIAAAVDDACSRTGFFYLAGLGIDQDLVSRVWDAGGKT